MRWFEGDGEDLVRRRELKSDRIGEIVGSFFRGFYC